MNPSRIKEIFYISEGKILPSVINRANGFNTAIS
jgi:hypothetical protein